MEKSYDLYRADDNDKNSNIGRSGWNTSVPDSRMDEEAALISSMKFHLGKS